MITSRQCTLVPATYWATPILCCHCAPERTRKGPKTRGKENHKGAEGAPPALECSPFLPRLADLRRAVVRGRPVPTSVRSATEMEGGFLHLSQWKPKRTTNWVVPRFDPGAHQIYSTESYHPRACRHDLECPVDPVVRTHKQLSLRSAPPITHNLVAAVCRSRSTSSLARTSRGRGQPPQISS